MTYNLELIENPADVRLRAPNSKITVTRIATDNLVDDMLEFVKTHPKASRAVGLAAPQVGINRRIIVVRMFRNDWAALANPRIVDSSEDLNYWPEGCLSHPGVVGDVGRPAWIKIVAEDVKSKREVKFTVKDDVTPEDPMMYPSLCRILCHEIDHLNGILFTDRPDTCNYKIVKAGQELMFKAKRIDAAKNEKTIIVD